MEWGKQSEFMVEMQFAILVKSNSTFNILMVPIVFIPFFGQLIIVLSLLKKEAFRKTTSVGILFCALPVILVLIGGVFVGKFKMIISSLPFFVFSYLYFRTAKMVQINK